MEENLRFPMNKLTDPLPRKYVYTVCFQTPWFLLEKVQFEENIFKPSLGSCLSYK